MKTPKSLLVVALASLSLTAGLTAQARPARPAPGAPATRPASTPAATFKIAYINSRAIMQQTPGYAEAEATFNTELTAKREEVAHMQASLDSAANDFETSSVLLSPTAKQAKQRLLVAQQDSLQQRQQAIQAQMEQRQQELLDPIQQRVQAVIEGIRAEQNYAIIFDVAAMGGAMVAADRSRDLCAQVIARLQPAAGH